MPGSRINGFVQRVPPQTPAGFSEILWGFPAGQRGVWGELRHPVSDIYMQKDPGAIDKEFETVRKSGVL